jgi:two-component system, CitB family, response regulator DctR
MTDWRVLIVEDDPTVAKVHSRFVAAMPGFEVVGIVGTAGAALRTLPISKPDLMLLDFGLPETDGMALLRHVRATSVSIDVIAVTAAASPGAVDGALRLGVVDYLVKPFYPDRLRQALAAFQQRRAAIGAVRLEQRDVDRLRAGEPSGRRWLPRDIDRVRLDGVRTVLRDAGRPLTAAQVAESIGVSRVTARRYLEYLVTVRDVDVEPFVRGRGRPTKLYKLRPMATPRSDAEPVAAGSR